MKLPSSSAPPNGAVTCPAVVKRLDYEGELVVVIGMDSKIAGYAVANDVSARDLQRREPQWTRAKGADGFCPWGPWITTADKVPDPKDLRITTHVNGELRQDSSTADLIFGPQELVDFISQTCTLEPGDLILTGTPSGVGMSMDPKQFLSVGRRRADRDRVARGDRACHRLRLRMQPELLARLGQLSDLRHAGQVLAWDQQVMMPPAGGPARGEALGAIESLLHERLVAPSSARCWTRPREDQHLCARSSATTTTPGACPASSPPR